MKVSAAISSLLALGLLVSSSADTQTGRYFPQGRVELVGTSSDGSGIRVVLVVSKPPVVPGSAQAWRWGSEFSAPRTSVGLIELYKDKERLFVPISAYIDLGNPKSAYVEPFGKGFRVVISGGEAATSYTATLVFEGGVIRSRKVVHGEFPDSAWEETVYSFTLRSQ